MTNDKAELLNGYFTVENLENMPESFTIGVNDVFKKLEQITFDEENIIGILESLNIDKAPGSDGIRPPDTS